MDDAGGAILIGDEPGPGDPTHEPGIDLSGSELEAVEQYEPSFGQFEDGNPSLAGSSFQTTLEHQHVDIGNSVRIVLQSQTPRAPRQVWETGVWARIFTDASVEDSLSLFGQELHRPAAVALPSQAESVGERVSKKIKTTEGFHSVVRFKPDVSWKEQTDAALQSTVKLWYLLIERWSPECAMYIETHQFRWESDALTMLLDIFAGRSPYTLRKRALALMRICDFLDHNYRAPFPIQEATMYYFLCSEREGGAPPSRLQGYIQAVTFCRFVFDMEALDAIVHSARCKGAAKQKHIGERVQASPLTVKEVTMLHDLLDQEDKSATPWNQLFAGAALFCLYARSRWGDLMRAESVLVDRDSSGVACYLEARVGSHKTMHSQQHRHQFLPMVAPCEGVRSGNWIERWIRVR